MNQTIKRLTTIIALLIIHSTLANADETLKAFPVADKGMQRMVIWLPEKTREQELDLKLELVTGKMMQTDGVNRLRLGARISAHPLQGWGYTYYTVEESGPTASTLMAVPNGAPETLQFVSAIPLLIRYNSRLPVVIYLPDQYQIQYRIWSAPTPLNVANPG